MERKRRVKYDVLHADGAGKFKLEQPVTVWGLGKVQEAINKLKESGEQEISVSLTFAELTAFRRALIIDDLTTELCRDNVLDGIEMGNKRKSNIDKN
jgi:hypothetical protein